MPRLQLIISTLALATLGNAWAAQSPTELFFQNLAGTVGEYHQATLALQTDPKADPIDLDSHEKLNTFTIKKIQDARFVLSTFSKGEKPEENQATTSVIERNGEKIRATYYDLVSPFQSYVVDAKVSDSAGTELSYFQSSVKYLDPSPEAVKKRKQALNKRQVGLAILVLALTLSGKPVPEEVIKSEDWMNVYLIDKNTPNGIVAAEVLLDPRGRSELKPNGEPSLTVRQIFHKGD